MRTWLDIATIALSKKSKGGFSATAAAGLPFIMQPGMRVYFVPPRTDAPRTAVVVDVSRLHDRRASVRFGFDGSNGAEALDGCHCLVDADDARAAAAAIGQDVSPAVLHAGFDGWTVEDEAGNAVGVVCDCQEHPTQLTLTLRMPDGQERLIPVADDLLIDLDEDRRFIRVRIPAGLLEL